MYGTLYQRLVNASPGYRKVFLPRKIAPGVEPLLSRAGWSRRFLELQYVSTPRQVQLAESEAFFQALNFWTFHWETGQISDAAYRYLCQSGSPGSSHITKRLDSRRPRLDPFAWSTHVTVKALRWLVHGIAKLMQPDTLGPLLPGPHDPAEIRRNRLTGLEKAEPQGAFKLVGLMHRMILRDDAPPGTSPRRKAELAWQCARYIKQRLLKATHKWLGGLVMVEPSTLLDRESGEVRWTLEISVAGILPTWMEPGLPEQYELVSQQLCDAEHALSIDSLLHLVQSLFGGPQASLLGQPAWAETQSLSAGSNRKVARQAVYRKNTRYQFQPQPLEISDDPTRWDAYLKRSQLVAVAADKRYRILSPFGVLRESQIQSPCAGTYLTPDIVARQYGVCRRTVYRWLAEGLIAGKKLANGRWQILPTRLPQPPQPRPRSYIDGDPEFEGTEDRWLAEVYAFSGNTTWGTLRESAWFGSLPQYRGGWRGNELNYRWNLCRASDRAMAAVLNAYGLPEAERKRLFMIAVESGQQAIPSNLEQLIVKSCGLLAYDRTGQVPWFCVGVTGMGALVKESAKDVHSLLTDNMRQLLYHRARTCFTTAAHHHLHNPSTLRYDRQLRELAGQTVMVLSWRKTKWALQFVPSAEVTDEPGLIRVWDVTSQRRGRWQCVSHFDKWDVELPPDVSPEELDIFNGRNMAGMSLVMYPLKLLPTRSQPDAVADVPAWHG